MKFQHAPAPWPPAEPDPQPELRAGFEALGFRVLGAAMRVFPTDAQFERLAAGYVQGDRELFREWGGRPYQVLAAPDGTAFVRLAWFWTGRYAEVSTVLPDGRLVTTSTDWGIDPAWPRQIRRWYAATTDRHREQQLWGSPSCSAKVVDGTPGDVWSAHRAQVADVQGGAAPSWHHRLVDALALYDAAQASRNRSARRVRLLAGLFGFLVALVPVVALAAVLLPGFGASVVLGLVGYVVCVVAQKQLWLRARHLLWLHPRFIAPVPQPAAD